MIEVKGLNIHAVIGTNDNYDLCLVDVPNGLTPVYGIVNKKYGVLEMSTSILSEAQSMHKDLDDWLKTKKESSAPLPEIATGEFPH